MMRSVEAKSGGTRSDEMSEREKAKKIGGGPQPAFVVVCK